MEISQQLLKPLLDRLFDEYHELEREVETHPSLAADEIRPLLKKNMREIEKMDLSAIIVNETMPVNASPYLRNSVRKIKMDLRSLQRRWKRFIVTQERLKKVGRNNIALPTLAA